MKKQNNKTLSKNLYHYNFTTDNGCLLLPPLPFIIHRGAALEKYIILSWVYITAKRLLNKKIHVFSKLSMIGRCIPIIVYTHYCIPIQEQGSIQGGL